MTLPLARPRFFARHGLAVVQRDVLASLEGCRGKQSVSCARNRRGPHLHPMSDGRQRVHPHLPLNADSLTKAFQTPLLQKENPRSMYLCTREIW